MPYEPLLGRVHTLRVARLGPHGAFLGVDDGPPAPGAPTVLLPRVEVPEGLAAGEPVEVFVCFDSEGRPVATRRTPKVTRGRVAFLEVTATGRFGAFVDWGMPKELLVPYAEQTRDVRVGDRHPVGVYLDDTGRLAGTMRVSELLRGKGTFQPGEWVVGEAWRNEPGVGLFAILEQRFVGRVPASEPHGLSRGEKARFRVAAVLPDGKVELSLRALAHEELAGDAEKVLAVLSRPGAPRVGDGSDPEAIRAVFGLSKKAFKRAVGRLLKEGKVVIDASGAVAPKGRAR